MQLQLSPKLIKLFMKNSISPIYYGNQFLNLEFNEEKLYRVLNYVNENKESLEEIPKLSFSFISNTKYLFRIYNGINNKNVSLSNTIINIENALIYFQIVDTGYQDFYIYSNRDNL